MIHDSTGPDRRAATGTRRTASLAVTGLLTVMLAACATSKEVVSSKEDNLSAAGFTVRPANTPARQAMLNRLPPHQFVQRPHGDTVDYVYADPLVCDCLYVGTQQDFANYQRTHQAEQIANQRAMTAQLYQDNAWDWSGWGPWGPGYGFGPGLGW